MGRDDLIESAVNRPGAITFRNKKIRMLKVVENPDGDEKRDSSRESRQKLRRRKSVGLIFVVRLSVFMVCSAD